MLDWYKSTTTDAEGAADKSVACESARQLKMHLGQQLVETLAHIQQLQDNLSHTAEQIEAVLAAQHKQQQEQLKHQQLTRPHAANTGAGGGGGSGGGGGGGGGGAYLSRGVSPTNTRISRLNTSLGSPLAAAAAALSDRLAQRREGGDSMNAVLKYYKHLRY